MSRLNHRKRLEESLDSLELDLLDLSNKVDYIRLPYFLNPDNTTPFEVELQKKLIEKLKVKIGPKLVQNNLSEITSGLKSLLEMPREYVLIRETKERLEETQEKLQFLISRDATPKVHKTKYRKRLRELNHELKSISNTLSSTPSIISERNESSPDINDLRQSYCQPSINAHKLILISPIFDDLIAGLNKRRTGFEQKVERLPNLENVRGYVDHAFPAVMQILMAFNRPNKSKLLLDELPKWISAEYERSNLGYEQKLSLPSQEMLTSDAKHLGVDVNSLLNIYQGLQSWDSRFSQVASNIPATLGKYYWRKMSDEKSWTAFAGWYQGVRNQFANKDKNLVQLRNRVIKDSLRFLPIFGIDPNQVDLPSFAYRVMAVPVAKARGQDNDVYSATDLKKALDIHDLAKRNICSFVGFTDNIPTLESILSSSSMREPLVPLDWVNTHFATSNYSWAHRDPILHYFVENSRNLFGRKYGSHHKSNASSDFENFVEILPQVQYLASVLAENHVYGLVDDLISLSSDEWVNHLDNFKDESVWKRHGGKDRSDIRRILTHMLSSGESRSVTIGRVMREKVKSKHLIETVNHSRIFNYFESDLFGAKRYMDLIQYSPYSSFRVLREYFINPEQTRVVLGLIDSTASNMKKESRRGSYGSDLQLFDYYQNLGHKIDSAQFSKKAAQTKRVTLSKLCEQVIKLHTIYDFEGRYYSSDKKDPTAVIRQKHERIQKKIGIILVPHINKVLDLYWKNSFSYALKSILPDAPADSHVDEVGRNIIGVYCTSDGRPQIRAHATNILAHYLGLSQTSPTETEPNKSYLLNLSTTGFNIDAWNSSNEQEYTVKTKDANRIRHHEYRFQKNIEAILIKSGIVFENISDGVSQAGSIIKDSSLLADLMTQYEEYTRIKSSVADSRQVQAAIYLEQNPARAAMMGSWVDGSCLGLGRGSEHSALTNAVDANKKVIYARSGSQILGRKLICINEFGKLVPYATYAKGTWDLENAFESYVRDIAVKCNTQIVTNPISPRHSLAKNIPLENNANILPLNFEENDWLDDGPISLGKVNYRFMD